jgi:4'-phosphopantetheinyl transferase
MGTNWSAVAHPVAPSVEEVHVYKVQLQEPQAGAATCWAKLSDHERRRAAEFQFDASRRRFVIARAALRTLLGQYLGMNAEAIELASGIQGKPRLADKHKHDGADLRFNIAHSGELALVAVARGCEVGVDVEQLRTVSHASAIARRYFHPAERDAILAAPTSQRDEAFLRCWTGKEAILKAVGSGITSSLAGFYVPCDSCGATLIELPMPSSANTCRCWLQRIIPRTDYIAAVACVGVECRLHCFTLAL